MKTRVREQEMIRFAKSEEGTEVWYRYKTSTNWDTILKPAWNKPCIYIIDNEYAELRKKSADTGRPIQMYNPISLEWETPTFELDFSAPIESYRLEPEEDGFEYPIYKRHKLTGCVVMFTEKKYGVIVIDTEKANYEGYGTGYEADNWIPHTNASTWEDYDYDYTEPTYYYRWEKLYRNGSISTTAYVTDVYAVKFNYKEEDYVKIEDSKRTWED